jgi:non-canonical purine NTP pyrophosphatase (RdgB/HAM1 family)
VLTESTNGKLTIVLATRNAGKAREFGRLLGDAFALQALPAHVEMPEETGHTFEENARLKAEAVFEALGGGFAVLADDSGLEVAALDGEPGVHSARYAGEHATDHENVSKLLAEMTEIEDRSAHFACSLCLILPSVDAGTLERGNRGDRVVVELSGSAEGSIELEPRGTEGFGYDPVFRPLGWPETLGEAATHKKDLISHRGAAARALVRRLKIEGRLSSES